MNNNNFFNALKYEKSMQNDADSLYKAIIYNILHTQYPQDEINIDIKRWDFNNSEGRIKQLADIDVTVIVTMPMRNNTFHYNISEKFRTADYNDMFVELYSKYPSTEGWGINTQADWICYHTPEDLYVVNAKDIKKLVKGMKNNMMHSINHMVEEMQEWGSNFNQNYYKNTEIDFYKIPTYIRDRKMWEGLCACIPWDKIAEWGVQYVKYNKQKFINDLCS